MRGPLKIVVHVLLFVVAGVVFYLGLGIGLQFNPFLGSMLWFAAAAIVVVNLMWILRPLMRKR